MVSTAGPWRAAEKALRQKPGSHRLRMVLADALARDQRSDDAVRVLRKLADDFAADGFAAKAIAVLKKIHRIDPSTKEDVAAALAQLVRKNRGQVPTGGVTTVKVTADTEEITARPPEAIPQTSELVMPENWFTDATSREKTSIGRRCSAIFRRTSWPR